MTRPRRLSGASQESAATARDQVRPPDGDADADTALTKTKELGSMYDYLAKIILLGPSGAGK